MEVPEIPYGEKRKKKKKIYAKSIMKDALAKLKVFPVGKLVTV